MASDSYKYFKIYLRKTEDKDLVEYIMKLPRTYRQHFVWESLRHYFFDHLQNVKPPVGDSPTPPASPPNNCETLKAFVTKKVHVAAEV